MKRRTFFKNLAAAGASYSLFPFLSQVPLPAGKRKLKILVLGGTNFVGPAIVNAALKRKHSVTLLNRGKTNPDLFKELPRIIGDREKGVQAYQKALKQKWDVVIDVWPEDSELVNNATQVLAEKTDHYLFISSIAVYNDFQEVGLNERSKLIGTDGSPENWGYSEHKARAERLVSERFPDHHTILRPGPITGWRDPAEDLLYWLVKLKRNEELIGPGTGIDPLQFIDVKDVGRFAIYALEKGLQGVYNTTGPVEGQLLWKDFMKEAKRILKSNSTVHWPAEQFLRDNEVRSFEHLPLWAPLSEDRGFMQMSMAKADAAGFKYTPLKKTIKDCLNWFEIEKDLNTYKFGAKNNSAGLDRERELTLIEAWKKL